MGSAKSAPAKEVNLTNQHVDQAAKGGAMGVVVYLCNKYSVDPMLTALCMPVVAAVLSFASSKIGDPKIASFFSASK
jgi:hypothetical protein